MKLILTLLIISNLIYCQINLKSTYVINNKPLQAIRFITSDKYLIIEYTKNKRVIDPSSIVDSGTYTTTKLYINFKSSSNLPLIKGKKLYLNNNLSKNWWNPKDIYVKSDTDKYHSLGWLPPSSPHEKPKSVIKHNSSIYTKLFYMKVINTYATIYDSLILNDFCGPGQYSTYINNTYVHYTGDTSYHYLIDEYETVVHESVHMFNRIVSVSNKKWRYKIMVEPGITIFYDDTKTFESSKVNLIAPSDAISNIFRYKTYVGVGSTVSSNVSGIYGLMDEFSAYRNGCHASIISYFKSVELNKEDSSIFIEQSIQTYFAYYEFRLFIAWYLDYAKKYQPKVYEDLMANWNFRIAFTLIDNLFAEDVKLLDGTCRKTKNWNFNYYEEKYVKYLKRNLPDWEECLTKFKIEGVSKSNWEKNLKPLPPSGTILIYKDN